MTSVENTRTKMSGCFCIPAVDFFIFSDILYLTQERDKPEFKERNNVHSLTKQFIDFCERKFNLADSAEYNYQSLSVCIIDCVYSLRAKYYRVTVPVVDRYAALYLNGNRNNPGDTVSMLIQHIKE